MNRTRVLRACSAAATVLTLLALTGCQDEPRPASDAPRRPSAATPPAPGPPANSSPATAPPPSAASASSPMAGNGRRSLVDARVAGGLHKLTGEGALRDVPVDPGEMRDGMTLVAGHYRAPGEQGPPVLFEGVDGVPEDTAVRREHLFRGALEHIRRDPEPGQPTAEPVDPGPSGGSVECLLASLGEDGDVVCGWADEGTAAVAVFHGSTPAAAGKLFVRMRADLQRHG
ncbi:hypothetical protein [Streptomyces sp. DH12]|uniref:hypothetical protein n=1 Tax=Streptomyces sp. DH12 TaxID=2857010 RepID=UPI001E5B5E35|nr:hypothetical protein [Streptomyces sp. DH12]